MKKRIMPHEELSALATGRLDGTTPEERQLALLWRGRAIVDECLHEHLQGGFATSPLHLFLWREQLTFLAPDPALEARLRLHAALERNITRIVIAHHAWRHEHNGNVVWEFTGPTGMGKSSCMLGLLEKLNHVTPDKLSEHLTIDVPELPQILPKLGNGSGAIIDEQSSAVGEGSLTQEKLLRNLEDQIRLSGIDLYWGSPQKEESRHGTSQGEFQAIMASPGKRETRFLVWLHGIPLGYCDLPWASPEMWAAYAPIKERNVQRALRSAFQTADAMDEAIRRLLANPSIQAMAKDRRPKVAEWKRWIKRLAGSHSVNQVQSMAEEIDSMLDTLANRPQDFRLLYGWEATPEMKRLTEMTTE